MAASSLDSGAQDTAQEFAASNGASQKPDNPGDYWSPQGQDQHGELQEQLGELSPIPNHDGTECLKWDDTLWSHAEHFKVQMQPCPCDSFTSRELQAVQLGRSFARDATFYTEGRLLCSVTDAAKLFPMLCTL